MRISGTGITSFQARILPEFDIKTDLAIKWFQTASGNWSYTDRGATVDTYETTVKIYRLRGSVEQFVNELALNRAAGVNSVTLSEFASNEKIFGADVVYTNIVATLLGTPKISQEGLKVFAATLTFRATAPTFTGTATFPTLQHLSIGYDANVDEYTINKIDSYTGVFAYLDESADNGEFRGTFQFTDTEMKNLRAWMRTNRGTTLSIASIAGVTYPFGRVRGTTFPCNVKVLELSDETMRGTDNWYATLRLAEVI